MPFACSTMSRRNENDFVGSWFMPPAATYEQRRGGVLGFGE